MTARKSKPKRSAPKQEVTQRIEAPNRYAPLTTQFPGKHVVRCKLWFPHFDGKGCWSLTITGPIPKELAELMASAMAAGKDLTPRQLRAMSALREDIAGKPKKRKA